MIMNIASNEISSVIQSINSKLPDLEFKCDEPLRLHTTFKIGGPVSIMFFPGSVSCTTELCDILKKYEITPLIMGNGSNILANDSKLDIVVVNTTKLCNVINTSNINSTEDIIIEAEAGILLSKLAVFAYEHSLSGLEFAHGIPGTLGGAVVMNAGAYDGEMQDVIYNTTAYNIKNGKYTLTAADHGFSYRHSRFSTYNDIVLSSKIRLQKDDKETIKQKMDELSIRRRNSQPLESASGGSTFKRPKEGYAAALIEQAGLKGFSIGGAQVSEKHAGFIINRENATFSDTMAVIEHVQETVLKQCGVSLELELKVVGG